MYSKNRLPKFVVKHDSSIQKFKKAKIKLSISKAFHHVKKHNKELINKISDEILHHLSKLKVKKINVEKIRTTVLNVLRNHKLHDAYDHYELVFLHIKNIKIKKVIKRDGRIENFSPHKIFKSIRKSFSQVGIEDGKRCEELTKEIIKLLEKKHGKKPIPVENIKSDVENILMRYKLPKVARAYILHRYI